MRPSFAPAAVLAAATAVIATGCGGETKGSGGHEDGGSPSEVSAATGCGDIFDAFYATGCASPAPPASELARQRTRYITLCESMLSLVGEPVTGSILEECTQAVKAAGITCPTDVNRPAVCAFATTGSLPPQSACVTQEQCSSGLCVPSGTTSCGACAATTPVGQDCSDAGCVGSMCVGSPATCQVVAPALVGMVCNPGTTVCASGLTCSGITRTCAAPALAGSACAEASDCDPTLTCGVAQTCQPLGTAGQACNVDSDCIPNLGCAPIGPSSQCAVVTWASSGQPCGGTVRCLVGTCNPLQGVCPDVIADGQACGENPFSQTCDVFAECINGTCALGETPICP